MSSRWWAAVLAVASGAGLAGAAVAAPLPEGLPVEGSALLVLGRLALGLIGAALLLAGARAPNATATAFWLVVALVVSWVTLAGMSYLLALGAALVGAAVGLAVTLRVPRVGWAVLACWPLPLGLQTYLAMSGSFARPRLALLALVLLGAAFGAVLPRRAPLLVAPALGTVLLAVAWPWGHAFWPLLAVAVAGLVWQTLAVPRLWPLLEAPEQSWRERRWEANRVLVRCVGAAAVVLGAAFLAAVVLVPAPRAAEPAGSERLDRLRAAGALRRPGLLLSPGSSFYLFGRALPVALLGDGSPWQRPALLVLGRSPGRAVNEARAVKDAGELARIRRAQEITAVAMGAAASLVRPGATEAELERAILAAFVAGGATGVAFAPIVGSGHNATLPHYNANSATLREGLVVMDIGCSVGGYASDMTRTFPVRGVATPQERKLLETVHTAKQAAETACRAGVSYRAVHKAAADVIAAAGFADYFTHFVGHHVGIEVHDPSGGTLQVGNVITIEPGIYVPRGAAVGAEYGDLGVRLEDTYVVTATGCEPLASYPDLPESLAPAGAAHEGEPR